MIRLTLISLVLVLGLSAGAHAWLVQKASIAPPPVTSCNAILTGIATGNAILTGTATALANLTCQ